ncbi:MAG: hypothetical protein KGD66_00230 [Candidatus Lokiarchaeota archaeon]|nr:hypothetical protein [Candidatus Lokiarchaeota archaeon]
MTDFLTTVIISIVLAVLFFISEFFNKKHPRIHISFIGGISVAYFFLVVLPEISENFPENPFNSVIFEYLFVVLGFVFVHTSEKLILQKVESKSQRRMRKLIEKEKILEEVKRNMEHVLTNQINNEDLDEFALKDIAQTLSELNEKESEFQNEINKYKLKIQVHISEDLRKLRFFTNFAYHLLVGIIIVGILNDNLIPNPIIPGILFFFFAWFRTIISHRSEAHIIFSDLDICEIKEVTPKLVKRYLISCAVPIGVLIGLLFEVIYPIDLEILYVLYSFISGVIMYTIFREVIPEKEKGNPIYFLTGFLGYTLIIIILNIYSSVI